MKRTSIFIFFTLLLATAGFSQNTLRMTSGQRLDKGQKIEVAGKGYLTMQTDGNLVFYTAANQPKWASGTNGKTVTHCIMQPDGNLVIYNNTTSVWASETWNVGANGGYLQIDLNIFKVAIYKANGTVAKDLSWEADSGSWQEESEDEDFDFEHNYGTENMGNGFTPSTPPPSGYHQSPPQRLPSQQPNTLRIVSGQRLDKDQKIVKPGGTLIMQPNGNLVLYAGGQPKWQTFTAGKVATHAIMQPNGSLVIYNNESPVWSSKSSGMGTSGGYFEIDLNTFKVAIYKVNGTVAKILQNGTGTPLPPDSTPVVPTAPNSPPPVNLGGN